MAAPAEDFRLLSLKGGWPNPRGFTNFGIKWYRFLQGTGFHAIYRGRGIFYFHKWWNKDSSSPRERNCAHAGMTGSQRPLFAARPGGDHQGRCEQDRYRQRDGNQDDRRFHRCWTAMLITARCRAKISKAGKTGLRYAGIGIAMATLIETSVRVTTRHSVG
jgi:hypothetical protein